MRNLLLSLLLAPLFTGSLAAQAFVPDGEGGGSRGCPPVPAPWRDRENQRGRGGPSQMFVCGERRGDADSALRSLQSRMSSGELRGEGGARFRVTSYSAPSFTPYNGGLLQACVTASGYYY